MALPLPLLPHSVLGLALSSIFLCSSVNLLFFLFFTDRPGRLGDSPIGSGGKIRRVQMLMPGYIKGWKTGTELDREGFKNLMNIELRRKVDSRGPIYEMGEAGGMGCRASWGRGLSRQCCSMTRATGSVAKPVCMLAGAEQKLLFSVFSLVQVSVCLRLFCFRTPGSALPIQRPSSPQLQGLGEL